VPLVGVGDTLDFNPLNNLFSISGLTISTAAGRRLSSR